jgi:hypothetical protein
MLFTDVFWHLLSEEGVIDGSVCSHCSVPVGNSSPRPSSTTPNFGATGSFGATTNLSATTCREAAAASTTNFATKSLNLSRSGLLSNSLASGKSISSSLQSTAFSNNTLLPKLQPCLYCNGTKKGKKKHYIFESEKEIDRLHIVRNKRETSSPDVLAPSWSPDIETLKKLLASEKKPVDVLTESRQSRSKGKTQSVHDLPDRGRTFIRSFFSEVNLYNKNIKVLDDGLANLTSLHSLGLTGNCLESLTNLPPALRVINIYANKLRTLNISRNPPPLLHMGLGFNFLSSCCDLQSITTLVSLDLSYNQISSLRCIIPLTSLSSLKHLRLLGNPLCLSLAYPFVILNRFPQLLELDGLPMDLGMEDETDFRTRHELKESFESAPNTDRPQSSARSSKGAGAAAAAAAHKEKVPDKKNDKAKHSKFAKKVEDEKDKKTAEHAKVSEERAKAQEAKQERDAFLKQDSALDLGFSLKISLISVSGLPDPWDDGGDADDDKTKGKKKGAGAAKKAKTDPKNKKDKGKKIESNPAKVTQTEQEEKLPNGDHVKRLITESSTVTFFLQYRLAGDEVYRTKAVSWEDVCVFNYSKIFCIPFTSPGFNLMSNASAPPSPTQWRDFFQLLGIDILLFKKESVVTTTETETTSVAKDPNPSSTTPAPAAASAPSQPQSRTVSRASNPTPTPKQPQKKKGKKEGVEERVSKTISSSELFTETCLGLMRFETNIFLSPVVPKGVNTVQIQEQTPFQASPEDWSHKNERLLFHIPHIPEEYREVPTPILPRPELQTQASLDQGGPGDGKESPDADVSPRLSSAPILAFEISFNCLTPAELLEAQAQPWVPETQPPPIPRVPAAPTIGQTLGAPVSTQHLVAEGDN